MTARPAVGVTVEEFVARYPMLYHMAEAGSWPSIQQHGLLSTSALLDEYRITGAARAALESERRSAMNVVHRAGRPPASIRDNLPMDDAGLRRCLEDGLTPADWYRLLNGRVFFWVTEKRLNRLRAARAYRTRAHDILIVDSTSLLAVHAGGIVLSPINSGCTKPIPRSRGRTTFLPLAEYPFHDRLGRRLEPVVELAVLDRVPDIAAHVVRVERRTPDDGSWQIWP